MVKREAVKSIEAQKHQMIAALYGNSAFDESKEGMKSRDERIKGIEKHFNKAIEIVYNPESAKDPELDWDNPFWAAAKRSKERRIEQFEGAEPDPEAPVQQHIEALQPADPSQFDPDRKRSYDQE